MNYVSTIAEGDSWKAKFTWIPAPDFKIENAEYPMTQSYGVCFNEKGEILVIHETEGPNWKIPGGTIEKGEHPKETLLREFMEEVTMELYDDPILLGAQLSESYPEGRNRIYQLRYACRVKTILDPKPDPDNGMLYIRKFIPASSITEHVKWGEIGDEIFRHAIEVARDKWNLPI